MGPISAPHSDWSSPESGVYTRPLDNLEIFFANLADLGAPLGREQWEISSAVKLSFPSNVSDPAAYLRRAWGATMTLNPSISAVISTPDSRTTDRFMTIPAIDEDAWVRDTFFSETDAKDANELFSKLTSAQQGMHWIPSSKEVLIRISHWKIDGMGTIRLWGDFLNFLSTLLREGLQASPVTASDAVLPRSVGDLFGSCTSEDTTPSYLKDAGDAMIGLMVKGIPSIGTPMKDSGMDADDVVPGATKRRSITLDEASTEAIIKACKEKKVSVSATIHTAMIRVLATYPQHPLAKNISTLVPVDLRKYLPAPYDEVSAAAVVSAHPLLLTDVASKSFEEISKEANAIYKLDFTALTTDEQGNPIGLPELTARFVRGLNQLLLAPPPPELPPMTTPSISSLGVVEKYVKRGYNLGADDDGAKLVVEEFFLGSEMLGKDMWSHISTFRDKLNIPMVFNSSFHEDSFIDDMLVAVKEELLSGLGVKV